MHCLRITGSVKGSKKSVNTINNVELSGKCISNIYLRDLPKPKAFKEIQLLKKQNSGHGREK